MTEIKELFPNKPEPEKLPQEQDPKVERAKQLRYELREELSAAHKQLEEHGEGVTMNTSLFLLEGATDYLSDEQLFFWDEIRRRLADKEAVDTIRQDIINFVEAERQRAATETAKKDMLEQILNQFSAFLSGLAEREEGDGKERLEA